MLKRVSLLVVFSVLVLDYLPGQTTNGQMTGTVTDSSGALVPQALITVTNQGTNERRTAVTDNTGLYLIPQLPPGTYDLNVSKEGFAAEDRPNVNLEVNQAATINFSLRVSSSAQTVEVTGAPPPLNTTSATIGEVVEHDTIVDLPLNGRQFSQLALLTPGASPVSAGVGQTAFIIAIGSGGISPSVNGQSVKQNNYTMDGVLNNYLFDDFWAISPPPDALEEFNVQSHITDAQFGISDGANINIATRSGTNSFHGSAWEFDRNAVLSARAFNQPTRLPYTQNQYGVFFSGPVRLPHFNGKDNTWFAGYWEGYRYSQTLTDYATTLLPAFATGDFSAVEGTTPVGTDDLGRPEYQNEIYDPTTSRADPVNPKLTIRDPFPGNKIPSSEINFTAPLIIGKFYPAPNLNVGPTVSPNYGFAGTTEIASDQSGIRVDHTLGKNDSLFGRFNRVNTNQTGAEPTPGYTTLLSNEDNAVAVGYTHLFGQSTILNLRYGYSDMNLLSGQEPIGAAFASSIDYSETNDPDVGLGISAMGNGYSLVNQGISILGPQWASDYHGDFSKVVGHHTLGIGGMFYRIKSADSVNHFAAGYDINGTSVNGQTGKTGYGPASFVLGDVGSTAGYVGNASGSFVSDWTGAYIEDQWKALRALTITAGIRYDYESPPAYNKVMSNFDVLTGQFIVNAPVQPLFPAANGQIFNPQYTGFQPRFGIAYQVARGTVINTAFAVMDDHNNEGAQLGADLEVSWPTANQVSLSAQDTGLPKIHTNTLPPPSQFLNPSAPFAGSSADPNMKIPYAMEYNLGIEQQVPGSIVLKLNYVGSTDRHMVVWCTGNTAPTPGPGAISSRVPYPQYGGAGVLFNSTFGNGNYNAFEAEMRKTVSSGLFFMASYTWSKSLDEQSNPLSTFGIQNFYDMKADWGPSDFNLPQIFVFSGAYALPLGKDRRFLSNSNWLVHGFLGDWTFGGIVSLHSGQAFECLAGQDVANVGDINANERCDEIGDPYGGANFTRSPAHWINPASFTTVPDTFGTEHRDDLIGPPYKDVDLSLYKDFPLSERARLQLRAESFNALNYTNYALPTDSITSTAFGKITTSTFAREYQFAAKVIF